MPGFDLLIAGEGPERERLSGADRAVSGWRTGCGCWGRGRIADLPALYGAADASVLASSREGWANVLLESMACGTPVVAANIWGNPEVVRAAAAGVIYQPNTPEGIAAGGAASVRRSAGSGGDAGLCGTVQLGRDDGRPVGVCSGG